MKRTHRGDLTALVVQIEKIYDVQGSAKRPAMKSRVDALSRTPAVTYRYNRKPAGRENLIYAGLFGLTIVVALIILFIIFSSLLNPKDKRPSASASPSASPSVTASVDATPEPTPEPTPEVTPEPTPEPHRNRPRKQPIPSSRGTRSVPLSAASTMTRPCSTRSRHTTASPIRPRFRLDRS
jgi:hypothetical protein